MTNHPERELPDAPAAPRWCAKGAHMRPTDPRIEHCPGCARVAHYRERANRQHQPFCREGHGVVGKNRAEDGSCVECAILLELLADPATPPRPAPPTWLDWAAVVAALEGRPLPRPLTTRETACLLTTLKEQRPDWSMPEIVEWIDACTHAAAPTPGYARYLLQDWWRRKGLPDPRITVERAIYAPVDGDEWIAERERAQAEVGLADAA